MESFIIPLKNETDTQTLGVALAGLVTRGDIVCLSGPLGVGKTTLARALIARLTGEEEAPSPSFSLVQTYDTPLFPLRHFDLYRLKAAEEVWELGFEEDLEETVTLIEWPEKIEAWLPQDLLVIQIALTDDQRSATVTGRGNWTTILPKLKSALQD